MADYTKTTNFLAKDSLPLNNAAKYVKGSEIDAEFNNLATADADNLKISALGTSVETALGVAIGSAGAPVLFDGAGGTPSSMTGTNITGTAAGLTAGVASAVALGGVTGLGTGVATFLATPSSSNLKAALTDELGSASGKVIFAEGTLAVTSAKTLTATNTLTLSGTDGSTLNIGTGGTLGTAAYTAATAYQAADQQLTDIAGLTPTDNGVVIGNGTNFVVEAGATLKTSLGLTIGVDIQAYDADTAKLDVVQAFTAAQTFPAGHQVTGAVLSGYGTGAGGTVTQITSKATAVTLDKPCGQIVTHNANIVAGFSVAFTFNNSLMSATDTIIVNSAGANGGNYRIDAYNVAAGGCVIRILNVAGVGVAEVITINFAVVKAVAA